MAVQGIGSATLSRESRAHGGAVSGKMTNRGENEALHEFATSQGGSATAPQSPKKQGSPLSKAFSVSKPGNSPSPSKFMGKVAQAAAQKAVKRFSAPSAERPSNKMAPTSPARPFSGSARQPQELPSPQSNTKNTPAKSILRKGTSRSVGKDSSPRCSDGRFAVEEKTPAKLPERRSFERPPRNSTSSLSRKVRSHTSQHRKSRDSTDSTIGSDFFLLVEEDAMSNASSFDLGPLLLKLASAMHLSGENPLKALECASRAAKFLERAAGGKPSLDLVMSLYILAAIYCRLGQWDEAIPVLQRAIRIPYVKGGVEHALAAFSGHMQLGDVLAILGQQGSALASYHTAYEIQRNALGEMDPRVGETCSYLAEAHLQALQFQEAAEMCGRALLIHGEHRQPGSVEEAVDRKLMALILGANGKYESALDHLVLANVALMANGKEGDVAAVDASIGDMYVALGRLDEAVFCFQKALSMYKSTHGEGHTSVASVYVSLADLYLKAGKLREAKTHCESALRIYGRNDAEHSPPDLANGLTEIASVYESMNEKEQALVLLERALDILDGLPGQHSAVAGVEGQVGVLYYVMGRFEEALTAFNNAVFKLRAAGERNSALMGILLNQLGLACVGINEIWHAADIFEEAKTIFEEVWGPHHADTLAVCSNLAGAYDALGRSQEAIGLLEGILEVKEMTLGTAHPDVQEEREWLTQLLQESGRVPKTNTLEELLSLNIVDRSRHLTKDS